MHEGSNYKLKGRKKEGKERKEERERERKRKASACTWSTRFWKSNLHIKSRGALARGGGLGGAEDLPVSGGPLPWRQP